MIGVVTRTDLRAAHTRRTRAAIRAAALALTRERGYTAMTIDDVAALAGVSRRTVFNHFSSKAELLVIGPETPEPSICQLVFYYRNFIFYIFFYIIREFNFFKALNRVY